MWNACETCLRDTGEHHSVSAPLRGVLGQGELSVSLVPNTSNQLVKVAVRGSWGLVLLGQPLSPPHRFGEVCHKSLQARVSSATGLSMPPPSAELWLPFVFGGLGDARNWWMPQRYLSKGLRLGCGPLSSGDKASSSHSSPHTFFACPKEIRKDQEILFLLSGRAVTFSHWALSCRTISPMALPSNWIAALWS